jgi:glutaredoxin
MNSVINIRILTAKGCEVCNFVKAWINELGKANDIDIVLEEIDSENERAINLAIKYNIFDIPSFIIGETVFCGDKYAAPDVLSAINKVLLR